MRIPEPLFPLINRIVALMLNSPLHGLLSGSVMVIYFNGRKSGQRRFTPVRYLRRGDTIVCTTSKETGWWHNFRTAAPVQLQVAGRRVRATARATVKDAAKIEPVLREFLDTFPQDASYHDIALGADGRPAEDDMPRVVADTVLVTLSEIHAAR